MDFYEIKEQIGKRDVITVAPNFLVGPSKDFMVRGRSFYAIWNGEVWSTNEFDVQRLVDEDLDKYIKERSTKTDAKFTPLYLRDFKSRSWQEYRTFLSHMPDTNKQLDAKLVFASDEAKRSDYSSKRLSYDIKEGSKSCYDELMGALFSPEEKEKLEWAIGCILAGDSKTIQKFIVIYGEGGTGKSTFLNIVQQLFEGYYINFEAKALVNGDNFGTELFRSNPLIAIQHDGNLSRIEDNSKLNSIIAHEPIVINEKGKPKYSIKSNAFLFMGTNKPVMITDSHSGIIRRLIDVYPTGNTIPPRRYNTLTEGIKFELSAIAFHCLELYKSLGRNYYNGYQPLGMMYKTDVFYNFVEDNYFLFLDQDGCTLKQAYDLYKVYCTESNITRMLPKYLFKSELKAYFVTFEERCRDEDGRQTRNVYKIFKKERFTNGKTPKEPETPSWCAFNSSKSIFDEVAKDYLAQYSIKVRNQEIPEKKWDKVNTKLKDLNTSKTHYVKVPENHIVIDFDLRNEKGEKSLDKSIEAASKWTPTYAEISRSEDAVHLHYIYDGDPKTLAKIYDEHIEIKVFTGNQALRRKLTKCNSLPIAHISSGLPKGEPNKVINLETVKTEQGLRKLIQKNLNKEIHPGTKPSIDFIYKILEDAYKSGMKYDVRDMQGKVLFFALRSTNQSEYCVRLVGKMRFSSEESTEADNNFQVLRIEVEENKPLVFYDCEVFKNLFIVAWKEEGKDKKPVIMINPTSQDIERLFSMRLVGFNNRRYDNHILYGRYIGYNLEQLYNLSQKLINDKGPSGLFAEAYNISWTDIYDFSSLKQSLKKFEIELGIHHQELGIPWDEDVPVEKWNEVAEYCAYDVIATEEVFNARKQDYLARLILAELSGLTPNHTTQQHTARIIFGDDPKPQSKFVYTDLSIMFPGYTFDPTRTPKSLYNDEEPSEGGYVYAEPGMYNNVVVLDVESMHPTSLIELNAFGPYTGRFKELLDARLAIKHKDFDKAKTMLGGVLGKYLTTPEAAKDLAYALKIVINIVYGLTSASFQNKFLDPRNKDNIVAKRGSLFMIDLKNAVQKKGFRVVHIKTDSIKIADATPEIIEFVHSFGKQYGYTFKHEDTYGKFCLVNEAVYIAKYEWSEDPRNIGKWTATGAQFAHPYIFKKLFSKEPLEFSDFCETKQVTTAMYLDYNEFLPEGEHNYIHVGRVGAFVPVLGGTGGGELLRIKEGKYYAVVGTKGWRWMEAEILKNNKLEDRIDMSYFERLAKDAIDDISKHGDFYKFQK